MTLRDDQRERYARQLLLPQVGEAGQARLLQGRVLVIGAGGLGSPAALYLAAAGVGTIVLVDSDRVDLSNLQRQILHATADVGRLKAESGRDRLRALNPDVNVIARAARFDAASAPELLAGCDLALDATDNFDSKYAIAEACHAAGRPYVHAGIRRFQGQLLTVLPGRTACYRCVFPEPPPPGAVATGPKAGVIGVAPGVIGTLQAAEALKFLLGTGELLTDRLLIFDALTAAFRTVPVQRNPRCALCGTSG